MRFCFDGLRLLLFVGDGRAVARGGVQPHWVVEAFDVAEARHAGLGLEAKRRRASSSASRVEKKLSAMALSWASPTELIEGRTPASWQRLPNARDVC